MTTCALISDICTRLLVRAPAPEEGPKTPFFTMFSIVVVGVDRFTIAVTACQSRIFMASQRSIESCQNRKVRSDNKQGMDGGPFCAPFHFWSLEGPNQKINAESEVDKKHSPSHSNHCSHFVQPQISKQAL